MEKDYKCITVQEYCRASSNRKYCEKCDSAVSIKKWDKHLIGKYHLESDRSSTESRLCYPCDICDTYIVGGTYNIEQHLNGATHIKNKNKQDDTQDTFKLSRDLSDSEQSNDSTFSMSSFEQILPNSNPISPPPNSPNENSKSLELPKSNNSITNHNINNQYPIIANEYMYIKGNIFPHSENDVIELKDKSLTDLELSKIFSGFMNNNGGFLFIGIADNRTINGRKFSTKELDEFKLSIDNAQQNCIFPSVKGIKINTFPVYTSKLAPLHNTYIIRIDIPKSNLEQKICAKDGEVYVRYAASFRIEGIKTFVHVNELQSSQAKFKNEADKNKALQEENKTLQEKNKLLYEENEKYKNLLRSFDSENNICPTEPIYKFGCMAMFSAVGSHISNLVKNILPSRTCRPQVEDHVV
jgi:Schlafen, AlbA_2